jgi:hypothetical protein
LFDNRVHDAAPPGKRRHFACGTSVCGIRARADSGWNARFVLQKARACVEFLSYFNLGLSQRVESARGKQAWVRSADFGATSPLYRISLKLNHSSTVGNDDRFKMIGRRYSRGEACLAPTIRGGAPRVRFAEIGASGLFGQSVQRADGCSGSFCQFEHRPRRRRDEACLVPTMRRTPSRVRSAKIGRRVRLAKTISPGQSRRSPILRLYSADFWIHRSPIHALNT